MFKTDRFIVVPYARKGDKLERGEARTFYTMGEAKALRERLARRLERVDLYHVTGWPVQDLWDRPRKVN
jgi:hypothetical protein